MKIIAAYNSYNKQDLTPEQIKADMSSLEKQHKEALEDIPTWQWFGGILIVGDHEYQVKE